MAVGKILRKPLVKDLEITGQEIVSGEYQETISKFETVAVIDVENLDTKVKLPNPVIIPENVALDVEFSDDSVYLAVPHFQGSNIKIYKQENDVFTKLADPDITPELIGYSASFGLNNLYLAVGSVGNGTFNQPAVLLNIYKRSNDTFTKISDPDIPPSEVDGISQRPQAFGVRGLDFSADGSYLALAINFEYLEVSDPPLIIIYKRDGDVFTKLPDPDILPPNGGGAFFNMPSGALDATFSKNSTYLAVVHYRSPFITIYKKNGDAFNKLSDPSILPPDAGSGIAFSPDENYLAISHFTPNNVITIYKRDQDTFIKLADPEPLPAGSATDVTFSSDGIYLAVSHTSSPFVIIYKRDGDTFTKLDNPDILPAGQGQAVDFSANNAYLAVGHSTSPFVTIYKNGLGNGIIKANNLIDILDATKLGYALENGTQGETKTMMSLFEVEE